MGNLYCNLIFKNRNENAVMTAIEISKTIRVIGFAPSRKTDVKTLTIVGTNQDVADFVDNYGTLFDAFYV